MAVGSSVHWSVRFFLFIGPRINTLLTLLSYRPIRGQNSSFDYDLMSTQTTSYPKSKSQSKQSVCMYVVIYFYETYFSKIHTPKFPSLGGLLSSSSLNLSKKL
ncbi:hypothetical protein QVD17_25802 [Tagetes erecta]|uniref:Uncharacterized protein n=1 Tax=Tagetes erecta TaxID=13708 RepID=A0AAD8NPS1_TARER|nr:hypothetical protein QVD17_25802 [Tagetes erecta]